MEDSIDVDSDVNASDSTEQSNSGDCLLMQPGPMVSTKPVASSAGAVVGGSLSDIQLSLNTFNFGSDSGYLNQVLHSIKNIVTCSACFGNLTPMKECSNGHLICQSCYLILRQLERPQCPVCRVGLHSEPKSALVAENVMLELPEVCRNCEVVLSRKEMANHYSSFCPRRKVSCAYLHLGCSWLGTADEAVLHICQCKVSKERSISEISEFVAKKEQNWNDIFQSFFSVLKRLESTDPQYRTVALSFIKSTADYLTFKSDQFHCNQSRWSLEVRFYQLNDSDDSYSSDMIGYRFTKENGVGSARKYYGFVLMNIRCDDSTKFYLRPQLNFVKFVNRGQITEFFSVSNVDQKFKPRNYHVIHAEIGIIRKTEDNDD